jgi:hypothetical protein
MPVLIDACCPFGSALALIPGSCLSYSCRGAKSRIPEKYASIDTSGLQVDVQKGMPPVTFDLTKN